MKDPKQNSALQRITLPLKAVRIRVLTKNYKDLGHASGFIRKDEGKLYLYTCWHIVTGFDPYDIRVTGKLPDREYLSIEMQDADKSQNWRDENWTAHVGFADNRGTG